VSFGKRFPRSDKRNGFLCCRTSQGLWHAAVHGKVPLRQGCHVQLCKYCSGPIVSKSNVDSAYRRDAAMGLWRSHHSTPRRTWHEAVCFLKSIFQDWCLMENATSNLPMGCFKSYNHGKIVV
jgi:hypothetical protein